MDGLKLPAISLARYRFTLAADDPMLLPPYKGSTLRGGFGHAFKRMVCFQPGVKTCTQCLLRYTCPYAYVFETPAPPDAEVLSRNESIPRPLVIVAPAEQKTAYLPGDHLAFHIVLVGKAAQYLPYFLVAFQELGRCGLGRSLDLPGGRRRGRFHLERVEAVDPLDSSTAPVYDFARPSHIHAQVLAVDAERITSYAGALPADHLTVDFQMPVRLRHNGKTIKRGPPFHVLVKALLGRLSSLAYFHCGDRWETDFRGWIDRAETVAIAEAQTTWEDWNRYSSRQEQRIDMGGLLGRITYTGDLAPYRPLLAAGALLHVGKGTVFGNGRYTLLTK